ncbi:MAG: hypothetical protein WC873_02860 [Candidatus Gracilibacteria bacterium]
MKLIKISPKFQITIPRDCRHLCGSGWFALIVEDKEINLRPVEIQPAKTDKEIMDEFIKPYVPPDKWWGK